MAVWPLVVDGAGGSLEEREWGGKRENYINKTGSLKTNSGPCAKLSGEIKSTICSFSV